MKSNHKLVPIKPCPLCGATITSRKITTCRQISNSTVECVDTEYVVCEICGCTAPKQAWQNRKCASTFDFTDVVYSTIRECDDEVHIETRFVDGEKFAAITIDKKLKDAEKLANFINGLLNKGAHNDNL